MEKSKTKAKFSARELTLIGIFAAITAVMAQIAIPLPFSPVPISFGLVAVYISGILLRPKSALFAQICYLALGAVGVPVFGNFRGGLEALLGPTGGYLLVYPLIAWIVSYALNSYKSRQAEPNQSKSFVLFKSAVAICIAHLILYLGGTTWLSVTTGTSLIACLSLAVFPYIPLDIVKILFCIFVIVPLRSRLLSMNLLTIDDTQVKSVSKKTSVA